MLSGGPGSIDGCAHSLLLRGSEWFLVFPCYGLLSRPLLEVQKPASWPGGSRWKEFPRPSLPAEGR